MDEYLNLKRMCAKDKGMEEMLSSTNAVKKVTGSMLSVARN